MGHFAVDKLTDGLDVSAQGEVRGYQRAVDFETGVASVRWQDDRGEFCRRLFVSRPDDVVLDFFAGSGTTGEAAALHGRGFVLIDHNPEAVHVAATRLAGFQPECVGFSAAPAAQAALF